MKVAVYAICKNEIAFLERWLDSVKEADYICVLDTGSDDGTWEALSKTRDVGSGHTAKVISAREIITPWRFDVARNRSMELIPADTDVCVCVDLDELFISGWRAELEKAWNVDADICRYQYIWNFNDDGTDGTSFLAEKIHRFGAFKWVHPVHEVLERTDGKSYVDVVVANIRLEHHADNSKSRASYLPLLEMSVMESPENDRNSHYLGREYMFHGLYDDAITALKRHLSLKSAVWDVERCASMRFISRCYLVKGDIESALIWALRACAEYPNGREAWYELEKAAYEGNDWYMVIAAALRCVGVLTKNNCYINEADAWGAGPWDMLSIAYWRVGQMENSLQAAKEAKKAAPYDRRIAGNVEFITGCLESKQA